MPELPEVQTTASGLDARIRGLTIVDVWTNYGSAFHRGKDNIKDHTYFAAFKKAIVGAHIERVGRRAKNVLIYIEKGSIRSVMLIHMKMTGHILLGRYIFNPTKEADPWSPAPGERPALSDPFNRFIRFVISFSDGSHLALSDMRRFAKVTLIPAEHIEDGVLQSEHVRGIGPEPLSPTFTAQSFAAQMSLRPRGRLKTVLMDQAIIAGVGNIYSDEALWRAGIHPEERVERISSTKMRSLYEATIRVLESGLDFGGDSMSDYRNVDGERGSFQEKHRAYRRTGKPCGKRGCTGVIARKIVGGRSAHYCPIHQRLSTSASSE